jgi:hypothetical protein
VERVDVCADHKKPKKLIGYLTRINDLAKAANQRTRPRSLVFANKIKTVKFIGDFLDRQQIVHSIFHGAWPLQPVACKLVRIGRGSGSGWEMSSIPLTRLQPVLRATRTP